MNYGILQKVCFTLILSFYNYASTFELNNGMRVHESYGDSVKQFITKVQNFEQKKILQNEYKLFNESTHEIKIEGNSRKKRRKKRREKKRNTKVPRDSVRKQFVSNLEMSKIRKFISSVCMTTRSRDVIQYCIENLRQ